MTRPPKHDLTRRYRTRRRRAQAHQYLARFGNRRKRNSVRRRSPGSVAGEMSRARDSLLTVDSSVPTLFAEAEVAVRFSNSQCWSMARPSYLAIALRTDVRVSESVAQLRINRHGGTLDSDKEGEAP